MPKSNPTLTSRPPLWKTLLLRRLKFLGLLLGLFIIVFGGSYALAPQWLLKGNTYRQAMMAHLEKKQVLAGDTHWVYYEGGRGPTLVLLHGIGSGKEIWLPVAGHLTRYFHLVIPDLPGWGQSSRDPAADYSLSAQANRLEAFVQALHLPGFVLIGHATGGTIAALYTLAHPDHVAGLALLAPNGLKADPSAADRRRAAGQNPFLYHDRASLQQALALAFTHPPRIPGRIQDVLIQQNLRNRDFIEHQLQALDNPEQKLILQKHLSELALPVMGLWCRNDHIVDYSALTSLRDGLIHATSINTTTMNDCGHLPMLEKPEAMAQILMHFAMLR